MQRLIVLRKAVLSYCDYKLKGEIMIYTSVVWQGRQCHVYVTLVECGGKRSCIAHRVFHARDYLRAQSYMLAVRLAWRYSLISIPE
jgi:hypothetical protein